MWCDVLQAEHAAWLADRYADQETKLPLMGLIGEAGEAAHALLSEYKEQRHGANPRHAGHNEALLDALGDCVVYLASWCNTPGVRTRLSDFAWHDVWALQECQLDNAYALVREAVECYRRGYPVQQFVDVLVTLCVSRGTTAEAVAMKAWQEVKGRAR